MSLVSVNMPPLVLGGSSESDDYDKIVTRRSRASVSRPSNPWVWHDVTGSNPTIEFLSEGTDIKNGRIYMYAPRQLKSSRNCDLFVFDTGTMKVMDLSDRMDYLDIETLKRFPMIDFPSFAFMSATDCLVVFGGWKYFKEDQSDGQPSSDLFLIDVSEHSRPRWWRQKVEGTQLGEPRIDATIAVVGNRIYLFGGVDRPHEPGEDPGNVLRSFSVIENDHVNQEWRWVVSDVPYPDDIPSELSFGRATPVHEGRRILLTPGRSAPSYDADFTSQNVFYFCTATHQFIKAKVLNDDSGLPKGLSSYHASAFIPPPNKYTLENDSKYPFTSRQKRRLLYQPVSSPESVLICGWHKSSKDKKTIPELWRLFFFPSDRVLFLNIEATEDLIGFPAEFHYFTVIDRRIYLLGSEDEEDFNEEDMDATDMLLDVCLDMTLEPSDFEMDLD